MIKRKIIIDAPIEVVFQVIRDFESYPKFLSTTKSAKEKKKNGETLVYFSIELIKPIRYTLKIEEESPNLVSWTFVEGDLMKTNEGSWKLKALSKEQTEAQYSIDVSFGWMVPQMIVDQVTKNQLPESLDAFKERAEDFYTKNKKKVSS